MLAKIRELRSSEVEELKAKLKEARKTVADLEAQISALTGDAAPAGGKVKAPRRKRMSGEEIKSAILKALAAAPDGLSQKEVSDVTGVNYQTVILFFKNNAKGFKTTESYCRQDRLLVRLLPLVAEEPAV